MPELSSARSGASHLVTAKFVELHELLSESDRFPAGAAQFRHTRALSLSPLDDADAGCDVDLFLIASCQCDLRNSEHRVVSSAHRAGQVFHNSLPLDLYYLIPLNDFQTRARKHRPGAGLRNAGVASGPDLSDRS